MNKDELRAIQKPIKERYRDDTGAGLITLRAEGSLSDDDVACSVQTGRALVEAGLHPATGGTGMLACSGDMLLQALVACAGVTLRSIATNRGLEVAGTLRAEGDLDFQGTMGTNPDAPVGFTNIRLFFDLQSDLPPDEIDTLIDTTEKYCVVFQTLANGVRPSLHTSRTDR